ncbi:interleukin-18-binding protein-like isoform X2 [Cyprinodon tularosa]|uniref:interleukin-18-binding protein-like isoform X2 n=1 Tax=Cyprinodon tularosa TaxID=77115 RepID=UPI0018E27A6C|nr:interleukin-18-binding protein-like isoform X2 [Cyprinodon tularosa]
MKLQSAIEVFGCVFLLLADGFPDFDSPKIIGPLHNNIKVDPGELLVLHCDAFPNCDEDEAVIYWLVNGTFPEETPSNDRIIESKESLMEGSILQKNLLLKNVTSDDLESTFSCVVTNAVGMAQKFIKLANTGCSSN